MDDALERARYPKVAPDGVAAMRALEHYCNTATLLEPVLLELVRLRASHLNGCAYCIGMHTHELAKHNEPAERIAGVGYWRECPERYTQREQAAFAWTEVLTHIQQGHASDADYAAARAHFQEADLVNLSLAIVSINSWNRMAIAFRGQQAPQAAG